MAAWAFCLGYMVVTIITLTYNPSSFLCPQFTNEYPLCGYTTLAVFLFSGL